MKSIFPDKDQKPSPADLEKELNKTFKLWQEILSFVHASYPAAEDEWKYAGEKFGWSFRIKDKKRVIVYMLPYEGFFQVSMVFGEKATKLVMDSTVADEIKTELQNAKAYAEGRGIRIPVKNTNSAKDIKQLISIKLSS